MMHQALMGNHHAGWGAGGPGRILEIGWRGGVNQLATQVAVALLEFIGDNPRGPLKIPKAAPARRGQIEDLSAGQNEGRVSILGNRPQPGHGAKKIPGFGRRHWNCHHVPAQAGQKGRHKIGALRIDEQGSFTRRFDFPEVRANLGNRSMKIGITPLTPNFSSKKKSITQMVAPPLNTLVQQVPHCGNTLIHSSNPRWLLLIRALRQGGPTGFSQVALADVSPWS